MKRLSIYAALFSLMLLWHKNAFAQEPKKAIIDTMYVDSIPESQMGNLQLLTLRIHNAFIHYLTKSGKDPKGRVPSLFERPEDSTLLKAISHKDPRPLQEVESITVTYDPKRNFLYGAESFREIIEVKFKKGKKQN